MAATKLCKVKIIQLAITIIDQQGVACLTMRGLAQKLGVKAASLYNHVENKAALLDMIQGYLYNHMAQLKNTKDWDKHLIELGHATRQGLLMHPNMLAVFVSRPTVTEASLAQAEQTLGILLQAGFKHHQVLMIFRNFNVFILGHVLAEVGPPVGLEQKENLADSFMRDEHPYPLLDKANRYKNNTNFDYGFKVGLESLVAGLGLLLKENGKEKKNVK